ncbi:MAG: tail fiber protein [Bacteroidales bacterium]|nr:tail fiber protein [Bacteroidales bacterium]
MDGFIGEIRAFSFDYEPVGWIFCDGRSLPLTTNQALFSIVGYTYGGSGNNFNIPKIPGKVLVGSGQLMYAPQAGGNYYTVGMKKITGEGVTLSTTTVPTHDHDFSVRYVTNSLWGSLTKVPAPNSFISNSGTDTTPVKTGKNYVPASTALKALSEQSLNPAGSAVPAAHENRQPYLAMNYCICIDGIYPVKP